MTKKLYKLEQLIHPISKENPTGENLRNDLSVTSLYYQIKDIRSAARNCERKILQWETGLNLKDEWEKVYQLSADVLKKKSKDLEVAVYYLEASVRQFGVQGLLSGFELITQLVRIYWDDLYPSIETDNIENRLAPLICLNGEESEGSLIQPIREILVTEGKTVKPFALWQYQQALSLQKISDAKLREFRVEKGAVTVEMIKNAARETSICFFKKLKQTTAACIRALDNLSLLLKEKCGKYAAPSMARIKNILQELFDHAVFLSAEISDLTNVKAAETVSAYKTLEKENAVVKICSRKEALSLLKEIANYFRETEPHSPIPYILERAFKWGRLTFPVLLNELVKDEKARFHLCEMFGLSALD